MKTLILIAIVIFIANCCSAQKIKESEVPKVVVSAFQAKFIGAKVKVWEKEDNKFEVEFDLNKIETSAIYSADGKLLETETEIKTSELPKTISEYVTKNFTGFKIDEALKITAVDGKISFEADIKKGKESVELLFDDKGNFIKKINEPQDKKEDKD